MDRKKRAFGSRDVGPGLSEMVDAVEKSLAIIGFAIGERFRPSRPGVAA
jgi:hypothetical protein